MYICIYIYMYVCLCIYTRPPTSCCLLLATRTRVSISIAIYLSVYSFISICGTRFKVSASLRLTEPYGIYLSISIYLSIYRYIYVCIYTHTLPPTSSRNQVQGFGLSATDGTLRASAAMYQNLSLSIYLCVHLYLYVEPGSRVRPLRY